MSNAAAQAYARTSQTTASPREIEAQALLMAAKRLQEAQSQWHDEEVVKNAVLFNRKLWSVFLSAALDEKNPQTHEIRQRIANLGIFVMGQTAAFQVLPSAEMLTPLIDINRNIAAGLSGRG